MTRQSYLFQFGFYDPLKEVIEKNLIEGKEVRTRRENEVNNMTKIKATKSIKLEDGSYTGTILNVASRETPFAYTDIVIGIDGQQGLTLTVGYPSKIQDNSELGLLLARFGVSIQVGTEYDVTDILLNKKCKFLVNNEQNPKDKKVYMRINRDSLKPL